MPASSDVHLQVTVYSPESSIRRPSELVRSMIHDLVAGRDLAWRLAVRDISAQYRQTQLGLLWAFIIPLATTMTWIFLNGSGVVSVGETAIPYPVYVFTGTMLWALFTQALNGPITQCNAAKGMLSKLNFSKEALIISSIYQTLFNGGIKIVLILVAIMFLGVLPDWQFLLFPLGVLAIVLAGTALGLLLTPIGLLYQDIGKGIPLMLQFLMYLTPVVYPMPQEGWARTIILMNPMTPIIMNTRNWLTGQGTEFLVPLLVINAIFLVLLLIAWVMYRAAMPILIERMNA